MAAAAVEVAGEPQRFCQQVGGSRLLFVSAGC